MREGTLREWRTMQDDQRDWGEGPWQSEPDKRQWVDDTTGLPCLMVRAGHLGHWCGYVGVPKGHPAYGKGYDDVPVEVHGGLTFSDECDHPTVDKWNKYRKRYMDAEAEAKRFPRGDAARFRKEWAPYIGSYDDWAAVRMTKAICHIPEPGEPDDVFWLGFDCAHSGDSSPGCDVIRGTKLFEDDTYKDVAYVQNEVTNLAMQLKKMI